MSNNQLKWKKWVRHGNNKLIKISNFQNKNNYIYIYKIRRFNTMLDHNNERFFFHPFVAALVCLT